MNKSGMAIEFHCLYNCHYTSTCHFCEGSGNGSREEEEVNRETENWQEYIVNWFTFSCNALECCICCSPLCEMLPRMNKRRKRWVGTKTQNGDGENVLCFSQKSPLVHEMDAKHFLSFILLLLHLQFKNWKKWFSIPLFLLSSRWISSLSNNTQLITNLYIWMTRCWIQHSLQNVSSFFFWKNWQCPKNMRIRQLHLHLLQSSLLFSLSLFNPFLEW